MSFQRCERRSSAAAAVQSPRLRARIWVEACLLACRSAGVFATVLARGDADGGVVLLKWRRPDGSGGMLAPFTTLDGKRAWRLATGAGPVAEAEVDAYCQRQRDRDPDMWVVEVETPEPWHPLGEPLEGGMAAAPDDDPASAAAALFKH
jgi:hypothetical protein